jgi:ribonuclease J
MEGTHTESTGEQRLTERDLENQIVGQIKGTPGLVLPHFSPMNVDRLVTFLRAAQRTNRIFVADHYTAWVMYLICHQCRIPDPQTSNRIRVYFPRSFLKSYKRKNQHQVVQKFERNRIEMEEILETPRRFLMPFRLSMLEDFDGKLPEGSCCIYSYWAGYLERPESADFEERVANAGAGFIKAHTSGHIFAEDTSEFLNEIKPQVVIPIHTFEPKAFRRLPVRVYEPKDGEVCDVERLIHS